MKETLGLVSEAISAQQQIQEGKGGGIQTKIAIPPNQRNTVSNFFSETTSTKKDDNNE